MSRMFIERGAALDAYVRLKKKAGMPKNIWTAGDTLVLNRRRAPLAGTRAANPASAACDFSTRQPLYRGRAVRLRSSVVLEWRTRKTEKSGKNVLHAHW